MPDENRDERAKEDDGRVIAPMNVEGMPWYQREQPKPKNPSAESMTRKQAARYTLYAVGAGLAIVFIFGTAGAAFIWFCSNVWFR